MADPSKCRCVVTFAPDGLPEPDLRACPLHRNASHLRYGFVSLEQHARILAEMGADVATRCERIANYLAVPTSDPIEAARIDAARHAWQGAADLAREITQPPDARRSSVIDGETVTKQIEGG